MLDIQDQSSSKMRKPRRVFVLEPIDGKPETTGGMVDKRLFTGENNLNAILDEQSMLWSLKYDKGITPDALKERFTTFKKVKEHVEGYFKRRNIRIKEIID